MSISLAALELLSGLAKVRDEVLVAPASSWKGDYCPVQMKVMPPGRSLHLSPSASVYLDLNSPPFVGLLHLTLRHKLTSQVK